MFNYRFRKKKKRKRKTQVGRGEGFYVVATSRARNNPLKYFSTSRVRRCFRVIHVFLSFFLSFFIINELLYLFVTYMFRGNRFLFFSSNFKFQRFFSSFYQKNLGWNFDLNEITCSSSRWELLLTRERERDKRAMDKWLVIFVLCTTDPFFDGRLLCISSILSAQ